MTVQLMFWKVVSPEGNQHINAQSDSWSNHLIHMLKLQGLIKNAKMCSYKLGNIQERRAWNEEIDLNIAESQYSSNTGRQKEIQNLDQPRRHPFNSGCCPELWPPKHQSKEKRITDILVKLKWSYADICLGSSVSHYIIGKKPFALLIKTAFYNTGVFKSTKNYS